jgi:two-component system sensor histidine kinase/response regulator
MTASAMTSDLELCRQAGMNDQVTKPIDVPELYVTLRRWVGCETPAPADRAGLAPPRVVIGQLPGIDLPAAVERLGSISLLGKLLRTFRRENDTTMESLRAALAGGDCPLAQRIVHTVKGVGGNLGATELAGASFVLEEALRKGDGDHLLYSALQEFELKLDQVLASIRAMEEKEGKSWPDDSPREESHPDIERITSLARELSALLAANSLAALGVWEQLKPLLSGTSRDRLDEAINSLNFPEAGDKLGAIAATFNVML